MPRPIPTDTNEAIGLDDLVDVLEASPTDWRDEDAFAALGPDLKRLANNADFLGDILIAELKARAAADVAPGAYTPQVVMLRASAARNYVIRANMWPALDDPAFRTGASNPFSYGRPHDHGFSFLTAGYFGPGYWSDYYEYDYATVTGYSGEPVALRHIGKHRLELGSIQLYRAHQDVHVQLPADSMSVSLNILGMDDSTAFLDQYEFDVDQGVIKGTLNGSSVEGLLALAAGFGGAEGADLLERFAASHPAERIRFEALKAQASAASDMEARAAVLERGARSGSPLVSRLAAAEAEKVAQMRAWLSRGD